MRWRISLAALLAVAGWLGLGQRLPAQEYMCEKLAAAPAADALTREIAPTLSDHGVRVVRGSRAICEIWLCKEWALENAQPATGLLYPFQPGELIGVIHFPRNADDFRQQEIDRGWYTLRYALQPKDGNHIGTFPTRDFILLVKAANDKSAAAMDAKVLIEAAQDAAGTTHPAMLALQPVTAPDTAGGTIRQDKQNDWWIVQLEGTSKVGGKTQKLAFGMVVIGHVEE